MRPLRRGRVVSALHRFRDAGSQAKIALAGVQRTHRCTAQRIPDVDESSRPRHSASSACACPIVDTGRRQERVARRNDQRARRRGHPRARRLRDHGGCVPRIPAARQASRARIDARLATLDVDDVARAGAQAGSEIRGVDCRSAAAARRWPRTSQRRMRADRVDGAGRDVRGALVRDGRGPARRVVRRSAGNIS